MGVPTLEVGYTSATTGRGDHEVRKGHVVALGGGGGNYAWVFELESSTLLLWLKFSLQLFFFAMHATCPTISIIFYFKTVGDQLKSRSSSLYIFFQLHVTSTLFRSNVLWESPKYFLPLKWEIVKRTLIFTFVDRTKENKKFCTEWWQSFTEINLLLIFQL
jgi:hypothetical protein